MDSGEDWQKPNTFGEAALRSLEGVLDQLQLERLARVALTQALRVRGRRGHRRVRADHSRARTPRRPGRPQALRTAPQPPVRHCRGSERCRPRRRRRDRAPLRLPDDRVVGTPLRVPRGVPRPHPRLGWDAARPAARRRRGSRGSSSRTRCDRTACWTPARRSRPAMRTCCLEPVEFLDESLAFLLDKVDEGASGARVRISRPSPRCVARRGPVSTGRCTVTPTPYRALDLIEGSATWSLGELSSGRRCARGLLPGRRGAGLRLRLRPRRATREARRRDPLPRRRVAFNESASSSEPRWPGSLRSSSCGVWRFRSCCAT